MIKLRVVTYCMQFKINCLRIKSQMTGYLSADGINLEKLGLIKLVKEIEFFYEIKCLQRGEEVSRKSKLFRLWFFLNKDNII